MSSVFTGVRHWHVICLCSCLFLCWDIQVMAGGRSSSHKLDSLKGIYEGPQAENQDLAQLAELIAREYGTGRKDSALKYASEAVGIYDRREPSVGKAKAMYYYAYLLKASGQFEETLLVLDEVIVLASGIGDQKQVAKCYSLAGNTSLAMGEADDAATSYMEALKIYEHLKDSSRMARMYGNLGLVQVETGSMEEGTKLMEKGLRILESTGDSLSISKSLNNVAEAYRLTGDSATARAYYLRAVRIAKNGNRPDLAIFPLTNLGFLHRSDRDPSMALRFFEEATALANEGSDLRKKIFAYRGLGAFYTAREYFDRARKTYDHAAEIAEEYGDLVMKLEIERGRDHLGRTSKDLEMAYTALYNIRKMEDSLQKLDKLKTIAELNMKYQTDQQKAENQRLRKEQERTAERQRNLYIIGGVIGVLMLAVIFLLFASNVRRRKFNRALAGKQEIIESQNATLSANNEKLTALHVEKDALMGIVAHDLKAPLNNISGLIKVLDMTREDETTYGQVREKIDKVIHGGSNLIEELVLMSKLEGDQEAIELEDAPVKELVKESVDRFSGRSTEKRIALSYHASGAGTQFPTHPEYLSRVLDNLISNAIKFSPANKEVWVSASVDQETFRVSIKDEGPGIAKENQHKLFKKFTKLGNKPTGGESSTGLGLSIVKQLVERMGGTISLNSEVGKGAEFVIVFRNSIS